MNFTVTLFGWKVGLGKKELSQFVEGLAWAVAAAVVNYVAAHLNLFSLTTDQAFIAGAVLKALKQAVDGR